MQFCSARLCTALCIGSVLLSGSSADGSPLAVPVDKTEYNLFRPTPRGLMRELSTDRPDKTESPYTLDDGHWQVEMDVVTFTYDRHNTERSDTRVESWSFATVNFKVGLLNDIDFQVVLEPWSTARTVQNTGHVTSRADGFGDVTLRTKINLFGNDDGPTAFSLMPFVKIPTNQDDLANHAVEGGLILPLAVQLPSGWSLGLMTELDAVEESDGDGYRAEWINTITFSHDLTERLGAYVEFFSAVTSESDVPWVGTFDVGLTYAVSDDIQLDAGVNIGLTRFADDVNPFIGLSWRF